jgi:hypothetical protein
VWLPPPPGAVGRAERVEVPAADRRDRLRASGPRAAAVVALGRVAGDRPDRGQVAPLRRHAPSGISAPQEQNAQPLGTFRPQRGQRRKPGRPAGREVAPGVAPEWPPALERFRLGKQKAPLSRAFPSGRSRARTADPQLVESGRTGRAGSPRDARPLPERDRAESRIAEWPPRTRPEWPRWPTVAPGPVTSNLEGRRSAAARGTPWSRARVTRSRARSRRACRTPACGRRLRTRRRPSS